MNKLLLFILISNFCFGQNQPVPAPHASKPVTLGVASTDKDLLNIRKRVVTDLLSNKVDKAEIDRLLKTQNKDGSWPNIDYKDVSRTGFQHGEHLTNMVTMARAFKRVDSPFLKSKTLKKAISKALDFWLDHDFICDNWWWNEMGTPGRMIDMLLIMDQDLTPRQHTDGNYIAGRANMMASGARPGGDLIQIAGMRAKQALFQFNTIELASIFNIMASEIKISTERGLQPDFSFHHRTDNVISTLSYGTGYASVFAYWAVKIEGTKYVFPKEAMELLVDYFLDGICQSLIYGKYIDPGAENRGITRKGALHAVSSELPQNLADATIYRRDELLNIVKIRKGEIGPNLTRDWYFWRSHYYTQQRPNYFISVRVHSDRAYNMEQPHNDEGILNHHYGDGSNFISVTGTEYKDIFPVWDWQKIPGTTVLQKSVIPHWRGLAKKGKTDFSGAVTDGHYGATAFDFESVHDPLKAKKAWFFFEKEYVCLGTSIHTDTNLIVATTLNQSLLRGDVVFSKNGQSEKLEKGNHALESIDWINHDRIGYYFTKPQSLNLSNKAEVGNWRRINHQASATEEKVSKDVFLAWLNHGVGPKDASYEYVVVPDIMINEMAGYKPMDNVQILSNTSLIQAVKNSELGITEMVFYQSGSLSLNEKIKISVEKPCIVMVSHDEENVLRISVADPTTKLTSVQIAINNNLTPKTKNVNVRWDSIIKSSIITFDLPQGGLAGSTVKSDF